MGVAVSVFKCGVAVSWEPVTHGLVVSYLVPPARPLEKTRSKSVLPGSGNAALQAPCNPPFCFSRDSRGGILRRDTNCTPLIVVVGWQSHLSAWAPGNPYSKKASLKKTLASSLGPWWSDLQKTKKWGRRGGERHPLNLGDHQTPCSLWHVSPCVLFPVTRGKGRPCVRRSPL
jgi:hypothetical protein